MKYELARAIAPVVSVACTMAGCCYVLVTVGSDEAFGIGFLGVILTGIVSQVNE